MEIDMVYFINLDKRKNRRDHLEEQFTLAGVPPEKVTRFSAIDGETYAFSSEEKVLFLSAKIMWELDSKIAHKIMGNQLSHFYIWKDMIVKNYKKILILQDDVVFCPNFLSHFNFVSQSLPADAQVVNIGLHKKAQNSIFKPFIFTKENDIDFVSEEAVNKHVCKYKKNLNPCSLSYILTDLGANSLVSYFTRNGFQGACDHNLNTYLIEKNIFYGSNKVLCTGNSKLPSDIFPPTKITTHYLMYALYILIFLAILFYVFPYE